MCECANVMKNRGFGSTGVRGLGTEAARKRIPWMTGAVRGLRGFLGHAARTSTAKYGLR